MKWLKVVDVIQFSISESFLSITYTYFYIVWKRKTSNVQFYTTSPQMRTLDQVLGRSLLLAIVQGDVVNPRIKTFCRDNESS